MTSPSPRVVTQEGYWGRPLRACPGGGIRSLPANCLDRDRVDRGCAASGDQGWLDLDVRSTSGLAEHDPGDDGGPPDDRHRVEALAEPDPAEGAHAHRLEHRDHRDRGGAQVAQ